MTATPSSRAASSSSAASPFPTASACSATRTPTSCCTPSSTPCWAPPPWATSASIFRTPTPCSPAPTRAPCCAKWPTAWLPPATRSATSTPPSSPSNRNWRPTSPRWCRASPKTSACRPSRSTSRQRPTRNSVIWAGKRAWPRRRSACLSNKSKNLLLFGSVSKNPWRSQMIFEGKGDAYRRNGGALGLSSDIEDQAGGGRKGQQLACRIRQAALGNRRLAAHVHHLAFGPHGTRFGGHGPHIIHFQFQGRVALAGRQHAVLRAGRTLEHGHAIGGFNRRHADQGADGGRREFTLADTGQEIVAAAASQRFAAGDARWGEFVVKCDGFVSPGLLGFGHVWLLGYACSYTIPGTGACRLSPVFHTPHSNYGDRRRAPVPLETQPYASNQRPPRQRHNILQHRRRRAHILIEHILQQGKIRHIVGADFLRVRQVRIELGVGVGGGGFVGGEAVLAQGV